MFKKTLIALLSALIAAAPAVRADDIEVYTNLTSSTPNIMFVLDLSDSMKQTPSGTPALNPGDARLDIMKNALNGIIRDPDLKDVNIGLMTLQRDHGGGPLFPVTEIDLDYSTADSRLPGGTTARDIISNAVDAAAAAGATPTVDAVYETARYFQGKRPVMGLDGSTLPWHTGQETYTRGHYRAYHHDAITGVVENVDFGTGDRNLWCANHNYDTTNTSHPRWRAHDGCAAVRSVALSCSVSTISTPPDAGLNCRGGTCDAGCGTYQACPDSVYTDPGTCLTKSNGDKWYTNHAQTQCCTQSDGSGSECLRTVNFACAAPVTQCRHWAHRDPSPGLPDYEYQRCQYGQRDTRGYKSPITQTCQQSAVVLLTDGDPSKNWVDTGGFGARDLIRRMILEGDTDPNTNSLNDVSCADQSSRFGQAPGAYPYPNCLIELAGFMHKEDQISSVAESKVDTYTIGFGLTGPAAGATWGYLQDVAAAGGGQAFEANNAADLTNSFQAIIADIRGASQTFQNFSSYLDAGQLATGNKTFLSMFTPAERQVWEGNLKGYFLSPGGLLDADGNPATEIHSVSGDIVFTSSARSFWSASSDGNDSSAGGFVNTLTPASRKIYTLNSAAERGAVDLNDGTHNLDAANTNITIADLGMNPAATAADRTALINWIRSARISDPLHTQPVLVRYGGDPSAGGIGDVLYFMTNQGMLHAVDVNEPADPGPGSSGGEELFAFVPYQLLSNFQQQSLMTTGDHIYGLDGHLTTLRIDHDQDGDIEPADGDKVILYFGMRRGGSSYFAMDVTNPNDPQHLWQIRAGDIGFEHLGQSWSPMRLGQLEDNSAVRRDILVFGGGYDPNQDNMGTARPSTDSTGMGIYIVDAQTGGLIQSFGDGTGISVLPGDPTDFSRHTTGMRWSIPGGVRLIDSNNNGIVDRLYAADLGAQIWRIDIDEFADPTNRTIYHAYKLADFSQDENGFRHAKDNRRFYYEPSIATLVRNNAPVYVLAIGSGYRAHPLDDTVEDQIFVFYDKHAQTGAPASALDNITTATLYNATANRIATAGTTTALQTELTALDNAPGWRLELQSKEKSLSRVRIYGNRLFLTTFLPAGNSICNVGDTINRMYALKLLDGTGEIPDIDNTLTVDLHGRHTEVASQSVILDEPKIVTYHEPGAAATSTTEEVLPGTCAGVFAGAQQMMRICSAPFKVNWRMTE